MNRRKLARTEVAAVAATVAETALAAWVRARSAGQSLPLHFGLDGRPDRWGSTGELASFMVIGAVGNVAVVAALGWAARRPEASEQRRRGLHLAQSVIVAVFATIALMEAGMALGIGGTRLPALGLALIAVVLGAAIGRVPPNALVGVRTPWSLSSRLAWDRANRLAGRLFLLLGAVGLAVALLLEPPFAMSLLGCGLVVAAGLAAFESWRVWRTDPERRLV